MKSKLILIFLTICCTSYSLDVSNPIKLRKVLSGNIVAWPINCESLENCHEINKKLYGIFKTKFKIDIIPFDTVLSFFAGDVPAYTDTVKLNEFITKYKVKYVIAPLIIDISTMSANGGVSSEIKERLSLPELARKKMSHLEESLKILNTEDGEIIARVYEEDNSRTNNKMQEILEVTEDLIKEIKEQ